MSALKPDASEMNLNLNDQVKVRWTASGLKAVEECHRRDLGDIADRIPHCMADVDADGVSRLQMWELIRILGPHMDAGFHGGPLIENMTIAVRRNSDD